MLGHRQSGSRSAGPAPAAVGPEFPPGCSAGRLRVPPPCLVGRLVHRLDRSAPVDVSLPYFTNLASARRVNSRAYLLAVRVDPDQSSRHIVQGTLQGSCEECVNLTCLKDMPTQLCALFQLRPRNGNAPQGWDAAWPMQVDIMQKPSSRTETSAGTVEPTLTISPEKVCFIIIKIREFDAKDAITEPDPG